MSRDCTVCPYRGRSLYIVGPHRFKNQRLYNFLASHTSAKLHTAVNLNQVPAELETPPLKQKLILIDCASLGREQISRFFATETWDKLSAHLLVLFEIDRQLHMEEELLFSGVHGIDSPRENLALYQKLMQTGCLAAIPEMDIALNDAGKAALNRAGMAYLVCSANGMATYSDDMLLRAASFLAGAADKFGRIHTDLVIFINSILRINTIEVTEEGIILVKNYFDFGQFKYDRRQQHNGKTATLLQGGPYLFQVQDNLGIYGKVFRGDWTYPGGPYGNPNYPALNFVRAADEAMAIIFYIHNYAVPDMLEEGVID